MSAKDELATILTESGCAESCILNLIAAIEDAFDRVTREHTSRSELGMKVSDLQRASIEVAKALNSINDLHFFPRMADVLTEKDGLNSDKGINDGLREAREFDRETRSIFSNPEKVREGFLAIAKACGTLMNSKGPRAVFSREGKPPDEERQQLGFELAALWHWATGKLPAASGSASLENPGTPFGRFVVFAADSCGKRAVIETGFSGFIRRTCAEYRQARRVSDAVTADCDGVKTRKKK